MYRNQVVRDQTANNLEKCNICHLYLSHSDGFIHNDDSECIGTLGKFALKSRQKLNALGNNHQKAQRDNEKKFKDYDIKLQNLQNQVNKLDVLIKELRDKVPLVDQKQAQVPLNPTGLNPAPIGSKSNTSASTGMWPDSNNNNNNRTESIAGKKNGIFSSMRSFVSNSTKQPTSTRRYLDTDRSVVDSRRPFSPPPTRPGQVTSTALDTSHVESQLHALRRPTFYSNNVNSSGVTKIENSEQLQLVIDGAGWRPKIGGFDQNAPISIKMSKNATCAELHRRLQPLLPAKSNSSSTGEFNLLFVTHRVVPANEKTIWSLGMRNIPNHILLVPDSIDIGDQVKLAYLGKGPNVSGDRLS